MIKTLEMYTVICDNCGRDTFTDTEYSCWVEPGYAVEEAMECDWIEHEGKHYCPDCVSYDDNDNLILKQLKDMK